MPKRSSASERSTDAPSKTPSPTRGGPPPGTVVDRRLGLDRRRNNDPSNSDLARRRGPGRRLSDFTKAAEEGEMTPEQFLFLVAIDEFKKANNVGFPSWSDVLEVIRLLGYRKTMPSELRLDRAEDWREPPNAKANVRPDRWAERFMDDMESFDDLDEAA